MDCDYLPSTQAQRKTMETAKRWLHDNCNGQKLQEWTEQSVEHVRPLLTPRNAYILIILFGVIYLAAKRLLTQNPKPHSWLRIQPRSPDPEKKSADINGFAEKRMKPTDRPPGSKYTRRNPLIPLASTTPLTPTSKPGSPTPSPAPQRPPTRTGPYKPPNPSRTDPSATGPTT